MSKSITIKSENNTSTVITTTDSATLRQILGSTQALTFFGKSGAEIESKLSCINGQPIAAALRDYFMQASPNDGDVVLVGIPVASFGAAQPQSVPGTVIVKWNGGTHSVTLRGIEIGAATVTTIVNNPIVLDRFKLDSTSLSACEVSLQSGPDIRSLQAGMLDAVKVADGDTVWMQTRKLDDKGLRD